MTITTGIQTNEQTRRRAALMCLQAETMQRQNRHQEAIRLAERVANILPDAPEPHGIMGRSLALLRMNDEAIMRLNTACELASPERRVDAIRDRAWAHSVAGKTDLEIADLGRILDIEPDLHRERAHRAQLLAGRGEFENAIADLEEILERDGRSSTAHNLLGHAHRAAAFDALDRRHDLGRAQVHIQKATMHLEIAAEAEVPHPQAMPALMQTSRCLRAFGVEYD